MEKSDNATHSKNTAGARWVERYLLPLIYQRFSYAKSSPLICLQIEPDDEDEAMRLRQEGHECNILLSRSERLGERKWHEMPLVCDPSQIPSESERYDLVLTGRFGRIAATRKRQISVARELARICKKSGAFLTTIGNRRCPIDFTGNANRLHGLHCKFVLTFEEMAQIFIQESGFSEICPLNISNHFAMNAVRGPAKMFAWSLKSYWKWIAIPEHRWLYASCLNPVLILWIER